MRRWRDEDGNSAHRRRSDRRPHEGGPPLVIRNVDRGLSTPRQDAWTGEPEPRIKPRRGAHSVAASARPMLDELKRTSWGRTWDCNQASAHPMLDELKDTVSVGVLGSSVKRRPPSTARTCIHVRVCLEEHLHELGTRVARRNGFVESGAHAISRWHSGGCSSIQQEPHCLEARARALALWRSICPRRWGGNHGAITGQLRDAHLALFRSICPRGAIRVP